jgi:hypothetical protein
MKKNYKRASVFLKKWTLGMMNERKVSNQSSNFFRVLGAKNKSILSIMIFVVPNTFIRVE